MSGSGQGQVQQVPLGPGGGRAYLWRLSSRQTSKVVITAHGCARNGSASAYPSKTRVGPRLHFFCRHGDAAQDEGLRMYTDARAEPTESVGANGSHDYLLQKYTNTSNDSRSHNSAGETYSSVRNSLTMPRPAPEDSADTAVRFLASGDVPHFSSYVDRAFEANFRPDVITIRGRVAGYGCVRLSDLLSWLEDAGYHYDDIYCAFCRSSLPRPIAGLADQFLRDME